GSMAAMAYGSTPSSRPSPRAGPPASAPARNTRCRRRAEAGEGGAAGRRAPPSRSALHDVGGLDLGVELDRIAPLLARAVARSLPAAERHVVIDAGGRQVH